MQASPGTQKKVIVRMLGGALAWGYLPPRGFGLDGHVELIEVDARAKSIAMSEIQSIAYVRDFNLQDAVEPEQMGRRSFLARPRGEALWVRVEFNQELAPLEGLMPFDLGTLDHAMEEKGIFLTPPEVRSNTLRLFVPRHAMRGLEVLGWVSSPAKRLTERALKRIETAVQAGLFDDDSG